jgi:two-component sensor histidine kinase
MADPGGTTNRTVEKLLRQQAALAAFGSFAFRETDLLKILTEAARICAASLEVPFCKVCRYRPAEDDLLIEAGCGWHLGVVGRIVSQADESSPQGRAYVTGQPVIIRNLAESNNLKLPTFYGEHGIVSTVDVVIPGFEGSPYGVLEIDSPSQHQYDVHDINFLTGFANVLAEAVATATRVKALQALVDEKNLLAEELQHRVRNNLQMLTAMLTSHARNATSDGARQDMGAIVRQVTTLAQVYDSLLGVGLSETIDLADYLRALCLSLPGLQNSRDQRVELLCRADSMLLALDMVTGLGMVVAELVTNSYGHAFPDRAGTISVDLSRTADGRSATLTIRDNGVGFVVDSDGARHGLGLVRRLMERMGGTLEVHSGDGTLWTMGFPMPVPAGRAPQAA